MNQLSAHFSGIYRDTNLSVADPDPFDPGSGMAKNQDPDPGWTTRLIFPRASLTSWEDPGLPNCRSKAYVHICHVWALRQHTLQAPKVTGITRKSRIYITGRRGCYKHVQDNCRTYNFYFRFLRGHMHIPAQGLHCAFEAYGTCQASKVPIHPGSESMLQVPEGLSYRHPHIQDLTIATRQVLEDFQASTGPC